MGEKRITKNKILLLLLFSIAFLIAFSGMVSSKDHNAEDILIEVSNYTMTLQEGYDNEFFQDFSGGTPSGDLTTFISGAFHTRDEIFIYMDGDKSLESALNNYGHLCSPNSGSYSGSIIKGHSGNEIIFSDGESLQEKINNKEFCCEPDTCSDLGVECGSYDDGCEGTVNCNDCSGCQSCSGGNCVDDDSNCASGEKCSGGTCVSTCTPETCSSLGHECGSYGDGCGGTVSCGGCPSGETCSGGTCVKEENIRCDNLESRHGCSGTLLKTLSTNSEGTCINFCEGVSNTGCCELNRGNCGAYSGSKYSSGFDRLKYAGNCRTN
ncbi:MAG: hypothetical protein ACOC1P_01980 [Minisyncoccales bacterium]